MAKGAYIGVGGVAKKIKKGYIGVGGVAKKIKKAYIGVGGVARPCWTGGKLAYYGNATALSSQTCDSATAVIGGYALIMGGGGVNYAYNVVNAYNMSLVRSVPQALSKAEGTPAAATVGSYAVVCGLPYSSSFTNDGVNAYDESLTRSIPTNMSVSRRYSPAAASIGGYKEGEYGDNEHRH